MWTNSEKHGWGAVPFQSSPFFDVRRGVKSDWLVESRLYIIRLNHKYLLYILLTIPMYFYLNN